MTKPQIREIAHSLGLKVADKVDSQEICFVPGKITKHFCVRIWAKTSFIAGRFTTLLEIFWANTGALSFSRLDSAGGYRAVRRGRATWLISIQRRIA